MYHWSSFNTPVKQSIKTMHEHIYIQGTLPVWHRTDKSDNVEPQTCTHSFSTTALFPTVSAFPATETLPGPHQQAKRCNFHLLDQSIKHPDWSNTSVRLFARVVVLKTWLSVSVLSFQVYPSFGVSTWARTSSPNVQSNWTNDNNYNEGKWIQCRWTIPLLILFGFEQNMENDKQVNNFTVKDRPCLHSY